MCALGQVPRDLELSTITKWESSIFEVLKPIERLALRCDSDGIEWDYSDRAISLQLPNAEREEIVFCVTQVPLEDNWYARRLGGNKVVFTFHEIADYLRAENIPLANAVLRVLYGYSILYLGSGGSIPDYRVTTNFTHDETRGCLFDMNGIKQGIVESCDRPVLCDECCERLRLERISENTIAKVKTDLARIKKPAYYRIAQCVKHHPYWSLAMSTLFVMATGVTASLIAGYIFEFLRPHV